MDEEPEPAPPIGAEQPVSVQKFIVNNFNLGHAGQATRFARRSTRRYFARSLARGP